MGFTEQPAGPQDQHTNQDQVGHGILEAVWQIDPGKLLDHPQQQAAQNGAWHAAKATKHHRSERLEHDNPQADIHQRNRRQQQAAHGSNGARNTPYQ